MTDTQDITIPAIGAGPEYEGLNIWLPALAIEAARRGEAIIEGKTYRNCVIEGPAVLLPIGACNFDGCNMGDAQGDIRNLLLQPMGPQRVTGTIAFKDCQFINCQFMRVGFTGTPEFLAQVQQVLTGGAVQ
ncbi:hypothetical protein [Brevundimonas sp.]|uniref:hypothetical protein n=1 Tax=Brevundimonas sp. TaxID=1871086 RepID=UPI00289BF46F|nr:hypothetical protein [Brevundimonas sp.]